MNNFGLKGINNEPQLGKGGNKLLSVTGDSIKATGPDGVTPVNVSAKDATDATHVVTKGQMDAAITATTAALALNDFITATGTPGTFAATVNVPAAAKVIGAKVVVTTAYNGTSPLLKIGTSATSSDNIDNGGLSDLAVVGSYEVPIEALIAGEDTPIICTLSGTGTTTGAATVYVEWANDN